MSIIDTNHDTTARLPALVAGGTDKIGRYISVGMSAKVIRVPEARAIAATPGVKLFLIYEVDGRPSSAMIGTRDGKFALQYAKSIGAPRGAVIYYTVDFDAGPNDLPQIGQAFSGFKEALGGYYRVGAYADGFICGALFKAGLIEKRWLTCSMGFTGTRDAVKAGAYDMLQLLPKQTAGLDADPDGLHVANEDIGDFVPFAPATAAPSLSIVPYPPANDGWLAGFLRTIGAKS